MPASMSIISNCVINLSPEKAQVFREACRVLKHGGRLAVSDVVATAPFPDEVQHDLALRAGCVAGASFLDNLEGMLADAGFVDIRIQPKDESRTFIRAWVPGTNIADYLISATDRSHQALERRHPGVHAPWSQRHGGNGWFWSGTGVSPVPLSRLSQDGPDIRGTGASVPSPRTARPRDAQHFCTNAFRLLRSSRVQKSAALLQYFVIFLIVEIWKKKEAIKAFGALARNTVSKFSGSWCAPPRMGCPPGILPRRWGCPPRPCQLTSHSSNARASSGRGESSAAFCMPSIPRGSRQVVTFLTEECCGGRPELCGYGTTADTCQGQDTAGGRPTRQGAA